MNLEIDSVPSEGENTTSSLRCAGVRGDRGRLTYSFGLWPDGLCLSETRYDNRPSNVPTVARSDAMLELRPLEPSASRAWGASSTPAEGKCQRRDDTNAAEQIYVEISCAWRRANLPGREWAFCGGRSE